MNDTAPTNPASPPDPSRRFGRTAVVVHLLSLLAAGMMFLIGYFQHDLTDRNVFSAFGMAMGGVGLVWSIILAVRAGINKEPLLTPLLIPLLVGWELSIPLALLWLDPQRGYKNHWYEIHFICAPLLVPLLTLCATAATLLFVLLRRRFLKKGHKPPRAKRSAAKIATLACTLLFVVTLPVGFVLYGGSMAYPAWGAVPEFWTIKAVENVPVSFRDTAFQIAMLLPKKFGNGISQVIAQRGYLSANLYRSILVTKDTDDSLRLRQNLSIGYARAHLQDLLQQARESLDLPAGMTVWDETLAMQFALNAPTSEILDLLKKRTERATVSGLLRHKVLIYLTGRGNRAELAESIAAMRESEPAMLHWRVKMLWDLDEEKYLQETYADLLQVKAPTQFYVRVTLDLIRRQKWSAIQAALGHSSKVVRKNTRTAAISCFWEDTYNSLEGETYLRVKRAEFLKMLSAPDRDEATALAILICTTIDEDKPMLRAHYGHLPNSRNPELDWQKIQSASAQEKTDLIEKASAILQNSNTR